jgi:hypothetical protein
MRPSAFLFVLALACNREAAVDPILPTPTDDPTPTAAPTDLTPSAVALRADTCTDQYTLDVTVDAAWTGETVDVTLTNGAFSATLSGTVQGSGQLSVGGDRGTDWPCDGATCPDFTIALAAGGVTASTTATLDATASSEGPHVVDADGDGYGIGDPVVQCPAPGYTAVADLLGPEPDCDDAEAVTNPGADELCDGLDNDCNTLVDDDAAGWSDGNGGAGYLLDLSVVPDGAMYEICGETPVEGTLSGALTLTGLDGAALSGQATVAASGTLTASGMRWIALSGAVEGAALTTSGTVDLTDVDFECLTNEIYGDGGAVHVAGGTVSMLRGSIGGCFAAVGAGAFVTGGADLSMDATEVYLNTATTFGGGVRVVDSTLTLEGAVFDQNEASTGGGVSAQSSVLTLSFAGFTLNEASENGGALHTQGGAGTVDISGSAFTDNSANASGGAVYALDPLDITATQFISNLAGVDGGGVFADRSVTTDSIVLFRDNVALGDGGGMWTRAFADVSIADTSFEANAVDGDGGGLYATGPLIGNAGYALSDVVFVENDATQGGGAFIDGTSGTGVTVTGGTFTENTAHDGAGLFVVAYGQDVAIDATASLNEATDGNGGVVDVTDGGAVTLAGTYTDNSATEDGGVAHVDADEAVLTGTFTGNLADGGAVLMMDPASDGQVSGSGAVLTGNVCFTEGVITTPGTISVDGVTTGGNDPVVFHAPSSAVVDCQDCSLPGTDTAVVSYGGTVSSPAIAGSYDVFCALGAACTYTTPAP